MRKHLARRYKSLLSGVPQDKEHHPEGDVLAHSRMVRKSIPKAIDELKKLRQTLPDILGQVDFSVSEEEFKVLSLAAWLHDIGKVSTTTIDGQFWKSSSSSGKIQSIGHQYVENYLSHISDLGEFAPLETIELFTKHYDLIKFLIQRHMDLMIGGFSRFIISSYFDSGKVKNRVEIKLLLILIWADRMGRQRYDLSRIVASLVAASRKNIQRSQPQSQPFTGTRDEFLAMLRQKGLTDAQIETALKGKYPE